MLIAGHEVSHKVRLWYASIRLAYLRDRVLTITNDN